MTKILQYFTIQLKDKFVLAWVISNRTWQLPQNIIARTAKKAEAKLKALEKWGKIVA